MADDPHAQSESNGPPTSRSVARRSTRQRQVQLRRRRAGAVLVLAVVALVTGLAVGAATGRPRHRHPTAGRSTASLRRLATLAAQHRTDTSLSVRENDAINATLARVPIVRMAGTQHREIALTFDDGPGPYTPQILAILRRTHTPATFFEVGEAERYFGASTAAIVAMGDPIGDHTETHHSMSQLGYRSQERELLQQVAATGANGAAFPRMFRPPYGTWDATTLGLLRSLHMLMVLWSVDTDDWQQPGADVIVDRALQGAKPGAIILMHDAGGDRAQTVTALPQIITRLRRRGYRLVTVPRLLLDNPPPQQQDVASLKGEGG